MSWSLPISIMRQVVAEKMVTPFSLSTVANAIARTKYPDQRPLQDLLNAKDPAASVDGFVENYFVCTPGIVQAPEESGSCDRTTFPLPLEIYICRKVQDVPHNQGATMLARAALLADALFVMDKPWVTVEASPRSMTGMVDRHMVAMTTRFPEADEMNRAGFAAVLLSLSIEMETTN